DLVGAQHEVRAPHRVIRKEYTVEPVAATRRDEIRMDDGEVATFLESNFRARVATIDRDGWPHVVPITYVVLDGRLTFWADRGSQKLVNLQRDPRIACIVDDGLTFEELRGLQVVGIA